MQMPISVGAGLKLYFHEVLQFVGLVVFGFWIVFAAVMSVIAASEHGPAVLPGFADSAVAVLMFATAWVLPALAVVALHLVLVRGLSGFTSETVHRWLAALVLLPLPVVLLHGAPFDAPTAIVMVALGLLLMLYGWSAAARSTQSARSGWVRLIEHVGLVLGGAYIAGMALIAAGALIGALP